jgi:hypothetical protein
VALGAVVVIVAVLAVANLGRGILRSREPGALGDLVSRYREYDSFRRGFYPNRHLHRDPTRVRVPYSVYPPYAFPVFTPLFEPGGLRQGAFLVNLGSLAALAGLGRFGWRRLRRHGTLPAMLGAMSAAAIPGVVGCLWVGQFSLVCVALLVAQLEFLERGRGGAAAICWALAMIKPQIALPCAVLFLPGNRWRWLAAGIGLLSVATLGACWWTGVSPVPLLHAYGVRQSLDWTAKADADGLPRLAATLGVSPRVMLAGGLAVACGLGAAVWWCVGRTQRRVDLLPLAGACGLVGASVFYHRLYDYVMLAPAIVAVLARASTAPGPVPRALAVIVPLTAWLPNRLWTAVPGANTWRVATWLVAGCILAAWSIAPATPPRPDAGTARA